MSDSSGAVIFKSHLVQLSITNSLNVISKKMLA